MDLHDLVTDTKVHRRIYTDPAIFALEMERIFSRAWLFVGRVDEVPAVGDFRTVEVEPLGDEEALVRSAFVIYVTRGSEQLVFPGRYEDRFRRVEENRWMICRRKAVLENDIIRGPLIFIV